MDATRSETLTYTYDELDRLDTVSGAYSHNYDYNPIGNITSKAGSDNPGTTNLIAWWRMNESSGSRNDSHSTNHLADHNTVGSTTGKKGNAALFVLANSEYLDIADNAALSMGAGARMTVCTWVKLTSKNATQIQEFVAKSGSTNSTYEYFLRYDGVSDRFEYVVTSNGSSTTQLEANANTFGSPAIGTWYFVCGGYDGSNIWVSVNAGARDTAAFSADIYDGASSNALQVGRFAGGSQYLDGALDEVVIYKRSLSLGEVSWLYNNGNGRAYADLSSSSPTTYTYNASHKHAVASLSTGETYTYDANGNMTCRVENGITYKQEYNAENLLSAVYKMNGTCTSGTVLETTSFIYDGDGNLVKKVKPDNSKTIYVGGVYEVDKASGGSIQRTVTYYPVAGAMRINSTLYYTLKDHLGSASVVTDASGTILGENRYYPYGETRLSTGTIFTDKLFTGQREMAGLGIYHYGARFYSPKLGRFLSADTIVPGAANPQAYNRYSYVLNNPLRYIDPSGHDPVCGFDYSDPECNGPDPWVPTTPPAPPPYVPLDPGQPQDDDDPTPSTPPTPTPSGVATMATVLDTAAMALNGSYALVGDIVGLVCQVCYGAVLAGYWYFSFIPNSISTISMGLWFMDGVDTGENSLTSSQTSQGTTVSLSVSQDTLVAVGTNIAGWTVLKEPNLAFYVDAGVAGYDYARLGVIPFVDYALPAFINPTLTYSTSTGLDFSWQRGK